MTFKSAKNQSAFLKAGLLGFQGSGKTYTAVEIAIGLHKYCKSDKPIFFLDTETGSDWAIPRFRDAGIELMVDKTRAFGDLLAGIEAAEKDAFCLIIDSVSHYWTEMIDAYKRRRNIGSRMAFHHWAVLKPEWQRFSNAYVNSRLHCIVCGRAGWEWGHEADDEGHKDLMKLGTKMKVEGEFAFEPSLLLEMERVKGKDLGSQITHICHVVKDRNMGNETMDGAVIENPTFDSFLPHVRCLNIGGEHLGVDLDRKSDDLFEKDGESFTSKRKRATVLVEEIAGELEARYPGTAKEAKIAKAALKKKMFGTYSDTEIADMSPDSLQSGLGWLLDIFSSDDWPVTVAGIIRELSGDRAENKDA